MEQQNVDLKQLPDVQIKALIYDEQNKALLAKNNIQALQQELLQRAQKTADMVDKGPKIEAPAVDTPGKKDA